MTGEFDLGGVYLPVMLLSAGLAVVPFAILRLILLRAGAYRLVWHRALFNTALYVVLLALADGALHHFSR